jgi:hypothetical protein
MARRLTCQIGRWVANLFKACLFDKCGRVIEASSSVDLDQGKHRIRPALPGHGHGLGDGRRPRGGGKGASTDGACGSGRGEESSPRRIYRRVCGWRAKHAVSLGHGKPAPGLEPGRKLALPLGLFSGYPEFMAKSIRDTPKKRRGRPSTGGRREGVMVRLEPAQFEALDGWIKKHDVESRPEAIRRLVELGLAGTKKFAVPSQATAARANKLAAEEIDRMVDSAASAEEQANRKRRLLKGPEEFRETWVDRPKTK